jgi:AraC-like DNA-binding protein
LLGLSATDTRRIRRALEMMENRLFPCSRALGDCFERLLAEHRTRGALAVLMARLTFHELLVCLLRDLAPAALSDDGPTLSPAIQRALAWIDDHLTEPLSPVDVAEAAGLSPSSLRQHFAAEVGCSPSDHITRQRIERAKLLLQDPKRSITEIALSLGFSASAYFTAVFKRLTGTSPRDFRRRVLVARTD